MSDIAAEVPTLHDATIRAFTFRKGMLARLGHDLRLTLRRFAIELADGRVSARFDLRSFVVDGAIHDGSLSSSTPSPNDKREIEATIARDIFDTRTQPEATFEGVVEPLRPGVLRVTGALTLNQTVRSLAFELALTGRAHAVFEITPSQWGIAAYKALGGALKLEDRVKLDVELGMAIPGADLSRPQAVRCIWQPS